jgi:hypothetical protein
MTLAALIVIGKPSYILAQIASECSKTHHPKWQVSNRGRTRTKGPDKSKT